MQVKSINMPPEKVVILMYRKSRRANGCPCPSCRAESYRDVEIFPGDTVIFAASPIPGNEKDVSRIVDNLFQLGAKVIYGSSSSTGMHVSGHGYQEDLKLMLTLMKPKYFIPIHGEFRMLHHHRYVSRISWSRRRKTPLLSKMVMSLILKTDSSSNKNDTSWRYVC